MAIQLISFPLYFEWLMSSIYPLQTPYLPIYYDRAYMMSVHSIYKCEQEAGYALSLLNNFNTKVIFGHNQYFKFRLNIINPSTGEKLYSSAARYYLSTSQINTFNKFIVTDSAHLRALINTLNDIHDVIGPSANSINKLFYIRTEVILRYSRSLNYITEAISNLNFFHINVHKSYHASRYRNVTKL